MKPSIAAFLMLALAAQPIVRGQQQTTDEGQQGHSASLSMAQAVEAATHSLQAGGSKDHILLRRNTPVCLRPSRDLSALNTKLGDHVTFHLHGDVSAEGLIVAADGTEVSATATEVKRSRRFLRDGKLTFHFDPLVLATGEHVPLMNHISTERSPGPTYDMGEVNIFALPFIPIVLFFKGDEARVAEKECMDMAIASDVSLDQAEIVRKQPQSGSWRARLQQLILRDGAPPTTLPPGAGRPMQSGNDIMELDLISGNERRLGECHHCYSPVHCPDCFLPGADRYKIAFLQADGIYAMWAESKHDVKHGSQLRVSVRTFSRIVGVLGADLALLDAGPQFCRIVLLRTDSMPVEPLDAMDCDQVAPGYAQQVRTGTPAWLDSNHLLYVRK